MDKSKTNVNCLSEDLQLRGKAAGSKKDDTGGGDLPQEFLNQWQRLSTVEQKDFLQRMNWMEARTVEVKSNDGKSLNLAWKKQGPFASLPPERANTVVNINKDKRDLQLEAVLEGIEFIHKRNLPKGLILNQEAVKAPITTHQPVEGCDTIAEVLGKGNSAGEITVFKDKLSGRPMALKTILISQFNPNEIRLWVQMGDEGVAPELYMFELKGNKLVFSMEIMTGKDLQAVIDEDMWSFRDPELARDFSLCVLHDLLEIWEKMRNEQFVHGDMHAGNLRLETSMNVKIFDFGRAKSLLKEAKPERLVKNDIVGIIRAFCALYSGYDFNDIFKAIEILEAKDLKQLDEKMIRISLENRKELYSIINMLFDTVRGDKKLPACGDTTEVSKHVRSLIDEDMDDIKKRAAVIIFPDLLRTKAESKNLNRGGYDMTHGGGSYDMTDSGSDWHDRDQIWDDPDMEEFVKNVSDQALLDLAAMWGRGKMKELVEIDTETEGLRQKTG